jgi:hypothetical protein
VSVTDEYGRLPKNGCIGETPGTQGNKMTKPKDTNKFTTTLKLTKETVNDLDPRSQAANVKGGFRSQGGSCQ